MLGDLGGQREEPGRGPPGQLGVHPALPVGLDARHLDLGIGDFVQGYAQDRLCTVPASELALTHVGRPLPNAALLGGFAAITGKLSFDAVAQAIRDRFPGKVGIANVAAARAAYEQVLKNLQREVHA